MLLFDIYFSFKNKTNNNLPVKLGDLLGMTNSLAIRTWTGHHGTGCWVRSARRQDDFCWWKVFSLPYSNGFKCANLVLDKDDDDRNSPTPCHFFLFLPSFLSFFPFISPFPTVTCKSKLPKCPKMYHLVQRDCWWLDLSQTAVIVFGFLGTNSLKLQITLSSKKVTFLVLCKLL